MRKDATSPQTKILVRRLGRIGDSFSPLEKIITRPRITIVEVSMTSARHVSEA
jgi:hypothetical protein